MGEVTDDLSLEALAKWPTPKEVLAIMVKEYGNELASYHVMEYLKGGTLVAASGCYSISSAPDDPEVVHEVVPILPSLWDSIAETTFWNTGNVRFFHIGGHSQPSKTYRFFDIRFCPEQVQRMLPKQSPWMDAIQAIAPTKHKGGAPKKDYWEDAWADIAAQLFVGDLKPTKQGDIEKAFLEWAAKRARDMGDQTARLRARKVWSLIQEKDKNYKD